MSTRLAPIRVCVALGLLCLGACGDDTTANSETTVGGETQGSDATDSTTEASTSATSEATGESTEAGDGDGDSGDGDGDGDVMTLPDDAERDWYVWEQNADDEFVLDIEPTNDGGLVVVGTRPHASGEAGTEGFIRKYDSDGTLLWDQTHDSAVPCGSACSAVSGVAETASGDLVVAGSLRSDTTIRVDAWVATLDADGTEQWSETFSGTQDDGIDRFFDVAIDPTDGSIYAGGLTQENNFFQGTLRKYSSAGAEQWGHELEGGANFSSDRFNGVAVAPNGDVVAVGLAEEILSNGGEQFVVQRLQSDGTLLWSDFYDELAALEDSAGGVDVDGSGNAFVVGTVNSGSLELNDIRFALYDSSGATTWAHKIDGVATGECLGGSISCDQGSTGKILADGNYALAGGLSEDKPNRSAYVQISDAAGANLWSREIDGADNEIDLLTAVAQGDDGALFVGGYLSREDSLDFFIAKYTPNY